MPTSIADPLGSFPTEEPHDTIPEPAINLEDSTLCHDGGATSRSKCVFVRDQEQRLLLEHRTRGARHWT